LALRGSSPRVRPGAGFWRETRALFLPKFCTRPYCWQRCASRVCLMSIYLVSLSIYTSIFIIFFLFFSSSFLNSPIVLFWMRGSVGRAVGAGVAGRTESTTRATIIGCFHVLILKNCRCQIFFFFSSLIHMSREEFFFLFPRLGWVCASGARANKKICLSTVLHKTEENRSKSSTGGMDGIK